jgi:hypothetical protein
VDAPLAAFVNFCTFAALFVVDMVVFLSAALTSGEDLANSRAKTDFRAGRVTALLCGLHEARWPGERIT